MKVECQDFGKGTEKMRKDISELDGLIREVKRAINRGEKLYHTTTLGKHQVIDVEEKENFMTVLMEQTGTEQVYMYNTETLKDLVRQINVPKN